MTAAALLCLMVGVATELRPLAAFAIAIVVPFLVSHRLPRGVLLAAVLIAPTLNPPIRGVGSGRLYALHLAILAAFFGAVFLALRLKPDRRQLFGLGLLAAYTLMQVLGRDDPSIGWVYRPLQLFLVVFAVQILFGDRDDSPLLIALAWGATIGCGLAAAHSLYPPIDPFVLSRPADLPFVSSIGDFIRATGAFTYPNNLGTFAAYVALFGICSGLIGRPALPSGLRSAMIASAVAALVLTGSRAATLGLLCGVAYLLRKAHLQRRVLLSTSQVLIGVAALAVLTGASSTSDVAYERFSTATGSSLQLRIAGWEEGLNGFRQAPLRGVGPTESRLDSMWVLYLFQGGVIGVALLLLLARITLTRPTSELRYPELRTCLLIAFAVSGFLQDSLGQTLSTWFLGSLLGVATLAPRPTTPHSSERTPLGKKAGHATSSPDCLPPH